MQITETYEGEAKMSGGAIGGWGDGEDENIYSDALSYYPEEEDQSLSDEMNRIDDKSKLESADKNTFTGAVLDKTTLQPDPKTTYEYDWTPVRDELLGDNEFQSLAFDLEKSGLPAADIVREFLDNIATSQNSKNASTVKNYLRELVNNVVKRGLLPMPLTSNDCFRIVGIRFQAGRSVVDKTSLLNKLSKESGSFNTVFGTGSKIDWFNYWFQPTHPAGVGVKVEPTPGALKVRAVADMATFSFYTSSKLAEYGATEKGKTDLSTFINDPLNATILEQCGLDQKVVLANIKDGLNAQGLSYSDINGAIRLVNACSIIELNGGDISKLKTKKDVMKQINDIVQKNHLNDVFAINEKYTDPFKFADDSYKVVFDSLGNPEYADLAAQIPNRNETGVVTFFKLYVWQYKIRYLVTGVGLVIFFKYLLPIMLRDFNTQYFRTGNPSLLQNGSYGYR